MTKKLIFKCIRCDKEVDMTICNNCEKGECTGKSYINSEMKSEIAFECPICKHKWNYFNCSCGAYNSPEIIKEQAFENGYITSGCYVATYIFKDENDSRIVILKRFRDNICNKFTIGKLMIKLYYNSFPNIIQSLRYKKNTQLIIKKLICVFCKFISICFSHKL